jgi:hypothetical protein
MGPKGSYRGYTNQFTFSNVGTKGYEKWADTDDAKIKMPNYSNESVDMNPFPKTPSAKWGCIIGFAVFGLGIIYAVIMIFIDMARRKAMYEELIQEDLQKMQQMGLGGELAEINKQLAERLAGAKEEGGVDDQLVTQALELRPDEFAKHM